MLLERRHTPRYEVDPPALITIDSVVEGTVLNASESGLAIATPYRPVLNSLVPIRFQLPDNLNPCEVRAQVVWSATSGMIGLTLLDPGRFRGHFENWRAFTTAASVCTALDQESDNQQQLEMSGADDLGALRAPLLEDEVGDKYRFVSPAVTVALAVACMLFGACIWLWWVHQRNTRGTASGAVSTHAVPTAAPAPPTPTLAATEPVPSTASAPVGKTQVPEPAIRAKAPTQLAVAPGANQQQTLIQRQGSNTQIVFRLKRFTRVHPKLLQNPDRIYFDLGAGTQPKFPLSVRNPLVRSIRIGHTADGRTRVVLDLRRPCEYRAKVSRSSPYKLTINLSAVRTRRS